LKPLVSLFLFHFYFSALTSHWVSQCCTTTDAIPGIIPQAVGATSSDAMRHWMCASGNLEIVPPPIVWVVVSFNLIVSLTISAILDDGLHCCDICIVVVSIHWRSWFFLHCSTFQDLETSSVVVHILISLGYTTSELASDQESPSNNSD
jgi:hypothetical protein